MPGHPRGRQDRLCDELEQALCALEDAREEAAILAHQRDVLGAAAREEATALARERDALAAELRDARASLAEERTQRARRAAASEEARRQFDVAASEMSRRQEIANVTEEELRVALEELQVTAEELAGANDALSRNNERLERQVETRTAELTEAISVLRDSESRLQLALEAGRLAFWELDLKTGKVVRAAFHDEIFGHDAPLPEWSYEAFRDHVVPEDREAVERAFRTAVEEGRIQAPLECRIYRAGDGEVRWLEVHGRPQQSSDGQVVRLHGVLRDITARKRTELALRASDTRLRELQAELLQISRLSAAGEMASALAHELNQPLTAATSALEAAQLMLAAPSPQPAGATVGVQEALDLAAEQAMRAGQIVRRLRDFIARGETERGLEHLPKLVEEASALAMVGARQRGVAVALRPEPGLPPVLVDRIQVQQVLFNLMRNALEAMADEAAADGGGMPRRRELVVTASMAGHAMVEVAVADAGPGLTPEVAERLFEPFVSTKPDGMGVGLSICRTIVEAHGGRLWAEDNPGGGTVFRFTLPTALMTGDPAGGATG